MVMRGGQLGIIRAVKATVIEEVDGKVGVGYINIAIYCPFKISHQGLKVLVAHTSPVPQDQAVRQVHVHASVL